MSDSEDPLDAIDEGGDDLFGDEGDEGDASPQARILDDDDLASDPEGYGEAEQRDYEGSQARHETKDRVVMAVQAYRHRIPKPTDDALRVMRVPKFVKFLPEPYDPETWQPSQFDLENARAEHPKHVVRVRRDPSTNELKSNTNIYRWSDGSVTIAVGGEHYEIQKKALAPAKGQPYDELKDGHYYAAAAELSSNLLMTVGHLTEQYTIRPNKAVGDDALSILAERMAMASKSSTGGDMIIKTVVDPELQKKQAELAEKERMKAQRKRDSAAAKMDGGVGRTGRTGLSIGGLEGPRSARKRGAPGAARQKRRRPEYDSDDDLPQGVTRHEEYDLDDGFLVGSDEEEMESDAEEEEEEEDILDDEDEAPRPKRQRTKEPEDDEDAEGDEVEPESHGRSGRRRNVIDDDDD
ncbi:Leo1-like domain-containing protein [Trichoderma aethiopicum]